MPWRRRRASCAASVPTEEFRRKLHALRGLVCQDYISPEERERRLRDFFWFAALGNRFHRRRVKPSQTESVKPASWQGHENQNAPAKIIGLCWWRTVWMFLNGKIPSLTANYPSFNANNYQMI
jgi:hypothetical protein